MSVDTRLFVSNRWRVSDIQEVLENISGKKVKYSSTHCPDYSVLNFTYKTEKRSMNVFANAELCGFVGNYMSLGSWGLSAEIMTKIAERLGGFLNLQDVNNEFQGFPTLGEGDLDFHLKHAIINGETDGKDLEDFTKKAKAYSEELHKSTSSNPPHYMPKKEKTGIPFLDELDSN